MASHPSSGSPTAADTSNNSSATAKPRITAQRVNIFLNVVVIFGLVVAIVLAGVVLTNSDKSARLMADTLQLAQELRVSSDDLTRFIRTYTVTNNASYWEYFNQVLDIRDGKLPLPSEPWRVWWDIYIGDATFPRGYLAPVSITNRMEAAGFTTEEMALFFEAKANSDGLVDLENIASNAMEGRFRPADTTGLTPEEALAFSVTGPPDQQLAMSLVHGIDYHKAKAQIMKPIDAFTSSAYMRVRKDIDNNYKMSIAVICLLAIMLAMLVTLLLIYFCKVAGDSQTAALLTTMLPDRVVESVTVNDFQQLRKAATYRITNMPSRRKTAKSVNFAPLPASEQFPVLYSEFLPMAWVAFTDVVNFTSMCRYTPAKKVIAVLNELFSLLDVEALNFGIEKIKTIGDAFMCAKLTTSELHAPVDEMTRVRRISDDGFQMVCYLVKAIRTCRNVVRPQPITHRTAGSGNPPKPGAHHHSTNTPAVASLKGAGSDGGNHNTNTSLVAPTTENMEIRAGLHVGPVASGIVGFERPLYDLFGDTVNTAARLEANGKANRVQVMETTLQYFDRHVTALEFEDDVQEVQLKGIGSTTTRLIRGIRSDPDAWSQYTDTCTIRGVPGAVEAKEFVSSAPVSPRTRKNSVNSGVLVAMPGGGYVPRTEGGGSSVGHNNVATVSLGVSEVVTHHVHSPGAAAHSHPGTVIIPSCADGVVSPPSQAALLMGHVNGANVWSMDGHEHPLRVSEADDTNGDDAAFDGGKDSGDEPMIVIKK